MLILINPIRNNSDAEENKFLVEVWKVAYAKARRIGWFDPASHIRCRSAALDGLSDVASFCVTQRMAARSAAAEAMGASMMLASDSAQRMRKGGQGEGGPMLAADTQATPKISTGT